MLSYHPGASGLEFARMDSVWIKSASVQCWGAPTPTAHQQLEQRASAHWQGCGVPPLVSASCLLHFPRHTWLRPTVQVNQHTPPTGMITEGLVSWTLCSPGAQSEVVPPISQRAFGKTESQLPSGDLPITIQFIGFSTFRLSHDFRLLASRTVRE